MNSDRPPRKTLTFETARLPFTLLGGLVVLLALWQCQISRETDPLGARSLASYGFTLTPCLIPEDELIGTDARTGDIPPLDDPKTARVSEVSEHYSRLAGIYPLVPGDPVIGVHIGDEARAYPIWVITAHEVINDTLGGRPIAVTYSPLCDSSVVFDREVGGERLAFGASGIVYNNNLVLHDRRPSRTEESLWSQLQFRAIAGPAAAREARLTIVPSRVVSWEAWREHHPETTVALPDPARKRFYRPNAFGVYFNDERLRYPVNPRPGKRFALKDRIVAVRVGGDWQVGPADLFRPFEDESTPAIYALWFAWDSTNEQRENVKK